MKAFATVLVLGVVFFSNFVSADSELDNWIRRQRMESRKGLEANIRRGDTAKGVVVASPSKDNPNYFFHWVRDAALVMNVVVDWYEHANEGNDRNLQFQTIVDYLNLSRQNQKTYTLSEKYSGSGFGEPKFNVDGSAFNGPWGRPQNDGPALRAVTLIRFANRLLDEGKWDFVRNNLYDGRWPTDSKTVVKLDLEYTATHWRNTDFDLWEEIRGHHFFTRMAQRRALLDGAALARRVSDPWAASYYEGQARELEKEISRHWDANRGIVVATLDRDDGVWYKDSGLDVAVLLAVLHSSRNDGFFNIDDDRILATAQKLRQRFSEIYPINQHGFPATAIGRYPEDKYNGYHSNELANPWVLATAAYAELYFRLAVKIEQNRGLQITQNNRAFFAALYGRNESSPVVVGAHLFENGALPDVLRRLRNEGTQFLARVRKHTGADFRFAEQMDRHSGYQTGAADLTWSYASFLTATDLFPGISTRFSDDSQKTSCVNDISDIIPLSERAAG